MSLDRITVEPGKLGGRPCIRGLRIPVETVVQLVAAGWSFDEILWDYPHLEREDITAALEYAPRQRAPTCPRIWPRSPRPSPGCAARA